MCNKQRNVVQRKAEIKFSPIFFSCYFCNVIIGLNDWTSGIQVGIFCLKFKIFYPPVSKASRDVAKFSLGIKISNEVTRLVSKLYFKLKIIWYKPMLSTDCLFSLSLFLLEQPGGNQFTRGNFLMFTSQLSLT